jgi:hypothetical protein
MAGAVLAPILTVTQPDLLFKGDYLIKNLEIVNEGDLVALDVNGFVVVASKTSGAVVQAWGAAFFPGNNGTNNVRVGDGLSVRCAISRKVLINGTTVTTVPGLGKGKPVYLGAVDTTTVSNYTCTKTAVSGDAVQQVGYVIDDGFTIEVFVVIQGALAP